MLKKVSLLILFSFLWCSPVSANCYNMDNSDDKYFCLATTKQESYQCYNIQNYDKKYFCLALVKKEKYQCYNIKENNLKQMCLGYF